jgi:hypothetical protein
VDQGAIKAICDSFIDNKEELVLVSLDTLVKLFQDNPKSQEEFK